jgi:hypothetical protein
MGRRDICVSLPVDGLLHGIVQLVHSGYPDELSCEICYLEMYSFLFGMVFCVLAVLMS